MTVSDPTPTTTALNPKPSRGFYHETPHIIFEQIKDDDGEMAFAVTREPQYMGRVEAKVQIGSTWYKPLLESRVYWNLPPSPSTYENEENLFERNRKFLYDYGDMKETGAMKCWQPMFSQHGDSKTGIASRTCSSWDTMALENPLFKGY